MFEEGGRGAAMSVPVANSARWGLRVSLAHKPITIQTALVFVLRDYKPTDFEEICAIDQECFDPEIAYSREEMRYYLRRKGAFAIVAEVENGAGHQRPMAGFTVIEMHPKGFGHVITIDIRRQFRGSGLGTQLMQAAEERVSARGARVMALEVAVNNLGAIRFYKRHGYTVVKTIPRYYPGELDGLLMTKKLGPAARSNV